jgi:hypothetical protein
VRGTAEIGMFLAITSPAIWRRMAVLPSTASMTTSSSALYWCSQTYMESRVGSVRGSAASTIRSTGRPRLR